MAKLPEHELLDKHDRLTHSNSVKVKSHVQREEEEWFINTIMLDGYDVPFKYKRKKPYKSLMGSRVNLTYYPDIEIVAGFEIEYMKVVRIKIA